MIIDGENTDELVSAAVKTINKPVHFSVKVPGMYDAVECVIRIFWAPGMWQYRVEAHKIDGNWARGFDIVAGDVGREPQFSEYMSTFTVVWSVLQSVCVRIDLARKWRMLAPKLFAYEREWALFCMDCPQFVGTELQHLVNFDIVEENNDVLWRRVVKAGVLRFAETTEGQMIAEAEKRAKKKKRARDKTSPS